jgi:hypothetical protein
MASPRYLIGGGEKLSDNIERPSRGMGDKAHPYTFGEAKAKLTKPWQRVEDNLRQISPLACPNGDAALAFTLHPSYLAKSYYPTPLMKELGLRHLGSRAVFISPEKTVGANPSDIEQPAPLLYLAGNAESLRRFSARVPDWNPSDEKVRDSFRQIEMVALPGPDRLKSIHKIKGRTDIPLAVC